MQSLIQPLPSGTAFCIGVVLIVMMTGRLVQTKGSLARAVLPFVVHLRWGWHRVERAMERGTFSLDAMFDRASDWCLRQVPVEPVRLGTAQREVNAIDSSTIARLRAGPRLALAGKGYCHRAGRAVRANLVAALTTVVMIEGVRVGLVRRTRFGASCEEAVTRVFEDLPPAPGTRLLVVDAGIATQEQCAAATAQDALLGRLRINVKLRCAPPPPTGKPGRRPVHGAVLHPGRALPEVAPDVDRHIPGEAGLIRLRRWHLLHYEAYPNVRLDVVRIDDPAYDKPLLVGTTASELTSEECRVAYGHRWPVETNFFVAQDSTAMEMPRAWTATALERRISLALLVGSLLKAIAAVCAPQAMGPWDRQPVRSAGRLANYLDLNAWHFATLALEGVAPRNYRKNPNGCQRKDLRRRKA
ncbi:MAG TPA: hypothetical protein VK864_11150, partial [Longimicrobiales bacterium]|nr:hypothetical protein [Longimicrobiales bacterium]